MTENMHHAPEPWIIEWRPAEVLSDEDAEEQGVEPRSCASARIYDASSERRTITEIVWNDLDEEKTRVAKAHARLIAAAPAMREALEEIASNLNSMTWKGDVMKAQRIAAAALALTKEDG